MTTYRSNEERLANLISATPKESRRMIVDDDDGDGDGDLEEYEASFDPRQDDDDQEIPEDVLTSTAPAPRKHPAAPPRAATLANSPSELEPPEIFQQWPFPGSKEAVKQFTGTGEDLETVKRIFHYGRYGRTNAPWMGAAETALGDLLSLYGYTDATGKRLCPPRRNPLNDQEEILLTAEMRKKEKEKLVHQMRPETISLCLDEEANVVVQLAQWYFHMLLEEVVPQGILKVRPAVLIVNDPLRLGWMGIQFKKELQKLLAKTTMRITKMPPPPILLLLEDLVEQLPVGVTLENMTGDEFEACSRFHIPLTSAPFVMVVDDGKLPPTFAECVYSAARTISWHLAIAIDLDRTEPKEQNSLLVGISSQAPPPPAAPQAPRTATAPVATPATQKNPYRFFQKVREMPGFINWQRGPVPHTYVFADPFRIPGEGDAPLTHTAYQVVQEPMLAWEQENDMFCRLAEQESTPAAAKKPSKAANEEPPGEDLEDSDSDDAGDDVGDNSSTSESDSSSSKKKTKRKKAKGKGAKQSKKSKEKRTGKKQKSREAASRSPSPPPPARPMDLSEFAAVEEDEDHLGGPRIHPREPSPAPSIQSHRSHRSTRSAPTSLPDVPAEAVAAAAEVETEEKEPVDPVPFESYFFFDRSDPSSGGTCPRRVSMELPILSLQPIVRPLTVDNSINGPGNLWDVHKMFWDFQTGATRIPKPSDAHSMIVQSPGSNPTTIFFSNHVTIQRGAKKQPQFKVVPSQRPKTVQQAKLGNKEEILDRVRSYHEVYLDPEHPRGHGTPTLLEKEMRSLSRFFQSGRYFSPAQLFAIFALALFADPGYEGGLLPLPEECSVVAEVLPPAEDAEEAVKFWESLLEVAPSAPRNVRLLLSDGRAEHLAELREKTKKRRENNARLLGSLEGIYDEFEERRKRKQPPAASAAAGRQPAPTAERDEDEDMERMEALMDQLEMDL